MKDLKILKILIKSSKIKPQTRRMMKKPRNMQKKKEPNKKISLQVWGAG